MQVSSIATRRKLSRFDSLTRGAATGAIGFYQKHISPHKGFSCAYRVLHRSESCSQFAKRTIQERGIGAAIPLIQERFRDCKAANQTLRDRRVQSQLAIEAEANEADEPDEGDLAFPDNDPDSEEPSDGDRRRMVGGSFDQRRSNRDPNKNQSSDCGSDACSTTDCGCDALDCVNTDCGSADCGGADCGSADCATMDCNAMNCDSADCSSFDCGSMDCSSCDCSGCDVGGCSW